MEASLETRRRRLMHEFLRGRGGGRPTRAESAAVRRAVELEELARRAREKGLAGELRPVSVYTLELAANRALREVWEMAESPPPKTSPPPKPSPTTKLLRELR